MQDLVEACSISLDSPLSIEAYFVSLPQTKMFTSTGLFKDVPCPLGRECSLINCIFHRKRVDSGNPKKGGFRYDPPTAGEVSTPPPPKRRRLDTSNILEAETDVQTAGVEARLSNDGDKISTATKTQSLKEPGLRIKNQLVATSPSSAGRPISPPPIRSTNKDTPNGNSQGKVKVEPRMPPVQMTVKLKEGLNPRSVVNPPQTHPKRKALLTTLHSAMKVLNEQGAKGDGQTKGMVLSNDELITMANGEEEQIARDSNDENIYRTIIGQRVMKYRRMKVADWTVLILEKFKQEQPSAEKLQKAATSNKEPFLAGLTAREEISVVKLMRTPLEGLEAYGYVTEPPSDLEIASARKGVETAAGFEKCERCSSRFQVFPGRDDKGRLTSHGVCKHHWAKLSRPEKGTSDRITGPKAANYPCCSGGVGSEGCTIAETHVFKVSESKRLASILQFERTPEPGSERRRVPVAIDCEMGFTTLGMEMIRLTAVSWPQGQELLDVLVRPMGEVLDLNTRFSGVSKDQFNKALPYGTSRPEHEDSTSEEGELESQPFEKVDSPAAARKLLFDLLSPDTPLIGHAIDNDLNVCRIIHPFVIDTVLLFPHPRGLPVRYGLKLLASKYLNLGIQTKGRGHDSGEDAKATGELVRYKIGEKWRQLRSDGWTFQDGILKPPKDEVAKVSPD